MPAWRAKKTKTSTKKNSISAAKAENRKNRMRWRSSRGPCRSFFQSSSPPPPPPPVGRRSTGGLPPIPGSFRSVSVGVRVKVEGIEGLCDDEITLTSVWTHSESEGTVAFCWMVLSGYDRSLFLMESVSSRLGRVKPHFSQSGRTVCEPDDPPRARDEKWLPSQGSLAPGPGSHP